MAKATGSNARSTWVGLIALALGVPAGALIERKLIAPNEPMALLIAGVSKAVAKRDREAAVRYHKAQSDLRELEEQLEARREQADRESEQAQRQVLQARRQAGRRIAQLQGQLDGDAQLAHEVERRIETRVVDNPETETAFRQYVDITEARIGKLTEQRGLYRRLLDHEQEANLRLAAQVRIRDELLSVTRTRLKLAEREVKRLGGRRIRFGPGITVGAGHDLTQGVPGRRWKPTVAVGVSIIWG